mmetsp:Transcript_82940/g.234978  ORF Transcript_82940/g.234978 Transcript_82940/m.234978 type:complete len:291 (-) Transcript_82940:495-1367(-)
MAPLQLAGIQQRGLLPGLQLCRGLLQPVHAEHQRVCVPARRPHRPDARARDHQHLLGLGPGDHGLAADHDGSALVPGGAAEQHRRPSAALQRRGRTAGRGRRGERPGAARRQGLVGPRHRLSICSKKLGPVQHEHRTARRGQSSDVCSSGAAGYGFPSDVRSSSTATYSFPIRGFFWVHIGNMLQGIRAMWRQGRLPWSDLLRGQLQVHGLWGRWVLPAVRTGPRSVLVHEPADPLRELGRARVHGQGATPVSRHGLLGRALLAGTTGTGGPLEPLEGEGPFRSAWRRAR